jgi:hypothetical protein
LRSLLRFLIFGRTIGVPIAEVSLAIQVHAHGHKIVTNIPVRTDIAVIAGDFVGYLYNDPQ